MITLLIIFLSVIFMVVQINEILNIFIFLMIFLGCISFSSLFIGEVFFCYTRRINKLKLMEIYILHLLIVIMYEI
jgi:hypothetical protein